jgi:hypothetical protein
MPPRPVVIILLFTENAANSSLSLRHGPGNAAFCGIWSHLRASPNDLHMMPHPAQLGCGNSKSAASGAPWQITGELARKLMILVPLFDLKVPEANSHMIVQGLRSGGTAHWTA